ncbi:hypothetical protein KIH39_00055 [Telmatocola sphagniphila]|uniref:Uncharacterized protein n=1 Tax=Telmatocola sphagniphila TaxID=1123043 RepID=A0A8E6EVA6_9BACT|nr:hypothetical protein [Telmatocola sphagniphila]QVL32347.1 hypothetical protein KIH39_00055 [Telmatocola sphagniphila]
MPTPPASSLTTVHQGHGGKVRLYTLVDGQVNAVIIELRNMAWTLNKAVGEAKATSALSGGIEQTKGTIKKHSGSIEFLWEDDRDPESLGFAEGATVGMWLKIGDTNKCYHSQEVLITVMDFKNDQDEDCVKYTLNFKANQAFIKKAYDVTPLTVFPIG